MKTTHALALFCGLLLPLVTSISSCAQNPLKGYEWLEGEWVSSADDDPFWARVIITKNNYKFVNFNWNDSPNDIDKAPAKPIKIQMKMNDILGKTVLEIEDCLYIDKANKKVVAVLGEFDTLVLNKVEAKMAAGYEWLEGKWEYDEDMILEITPSKILLYQGGKIIDQATYRIDDEHIDAEWEMGIFGDGLTFQRSKTLWVEGGDELRKIGNR